MESQTMVLKTLSHVCTLIVMVSQTVTDRRTEALLERLRSRQQLPLGPERRRIREAAGVSLRQLAAAIGVSAMAIMRWEQGATPRDPAHLHAYGRLLQELRHFGEVSAH
jgi:DNA-binding transcriptional regulator YiaG